jgi:O-antigen/teichoic acid export membrane protein
LTQRKLKTNYVINVIGAGLPFAVALITVPLYVAQVGTARFGVIIIVWILLGYFGFMDLGLSRASANALAKRTTASRMEWANVFMMSLYLNLFLGITGGFILYLFGDILMRHVLTLSGPIAAELESSFQWIAGLLPLLFLAGVCRGAIESRERFITANLFDVAGYVLAQVLPLLAAIFIAPTLPVVLSAAFAARVASVLLMLSFVVVVEKIRTLRVHDRSKLTELISFGAWAGLTSIISPILQFLDQLLVGLFHGATAVAHYAVPMSLVVRSQFVAGALSRATFPRFSRIDRAKAIELGEGSVSSLGFIYGAICAPAIVLSKPLMTLWIGFDFAVEAAPILEILLLGAWINGIAFIPYGLLQGQGRPDVVAKVHALEIVPYVLLLWLMLNKFGVLGAAIAWTVRVAVDTVLLLRLAELRARYMAGLTVGVGLMLASYVTTISLKEPSAPLLAIALSSLFFLMFLIFAVIYDPNIRRFAEKYWQRI